ncbi:MULTISPECIES: hypothetical protein [Bacillus]|uniref:hypothetical protein n=1 Tax=Bacillus TaxID=1386 RepID=UPI00295F781A|nr:hypothetical protein [Bacillus cereus]HEF1868227.1 hypothetical protein [Bacillus cereus]HEF1878764.1 hypothetical protein [Bacillus cereus]HEF1884748.1 hypothetical protein [Bacillus cereus]
MNKPVKDFVTVERNVGNYNVLNSSDVSVSYYFKFPNRLNEVVTKLGIKRSYIITEEKDYINTDDTALDIAFELKEAINSYWINTDKEKIDKLVEFLERIEEEEEQHRRDYEIKHAEYQVDFWTNRLKELKVND